MDCTIWNQILYELTFSVSGEQELGKLVKKASLAFLKKLDCAHVSILQYKNSGFETACVIPRISSEDPAYHELVEEFSEAASENRERSYIIINKDLFYYGFLLKGFGLLLMGRNEPIEENFLKELVPVTNMLAQNCSFNYEAVKKREAIEAELRQERRLLRSIIDTIPDMIFYRDVKGIYKLVNDATAGFFSLSPGEIIGRSLWDVHPLPEARECRKTDCEAIKSGHIQRYEAQLKNPEDKLHPFEILKAPIYDEADNCIGVVAVSRNIKERKHYEQQLEYMGTHDQLTGLYNRRFLEEEINQLDTRRQLPVSVIMADINCLKLINDVFGYQEGDNLIVKAAGIIESSCREDDLVIRWGGDEFVVFLPRTDAETVEKISLRIGENCNSQRSGFIQIGLALGFATKERVSENIWQVFRGASEKMYIDKLQHRQEYKESVISSLKTALLEKSAETEEHAERLILVCKEIGKSMGLDPQRLKQLELLAMFHDIGKVVIEKSVLMKQGPLTGEEWVQMRKHPEVGYRFAQAVPEFSSIAESILCHHERWDGKGYPRGIKGEDIPLLSRILAVADAFDAMTNNRAYQKAVSHQEALKVIENNAGIQFDPAIAHEFCRLNMAKK